MRSYHRVALGLLASGAALLAPSAAGAAVTTFENDAPITIPASGTASPYPSTIAVDGLTTAIQDVDVTLRGYSHTCPVDVSALVVAPDGAQALLMADLGFGLGCPDSVDADLTFDDAAAADVPYPPVSGTYRPTDPEPPSAGGPTIFPPPAPAGDTHPLSLSAFNGGTLNGTWNLFVYDQNGGDSGSIAGGWELSITNDTDPPETTITKGAPDKLHKPKAKFRFASDEPGSTFECKLDKQPFKPCSSPRKAKHLDDGRHRFKVRATDAAGNTDPTAAKDKFKVVD